MADNLHEPKGRRWHDNRGDLSEVMYLLESIPVEIRPHLAAALTRRAEEQFHAGEILKSLKSLGREKILALHQSRRKRRAYDQDAHLSDMVKTFFVLPDADQEGLARDFLAFTELVVEYMANCDSFEVAPSEQELIGLRNAFVDVGPDAVREYLNEIHKPFYKKILEDDAAMPASGSSIVQGDQGLRIKNPQIEQ